MKRPYLREYLKIIKLIIVISIVISLFSVYLDFFVLHNSLLLSLADVTLLVTLVIVHVFFEQIIDNFRVRQVIVGGFPLIYFPLAWLGSSGNNQIGVLYFFLFSSVMIFINPTRTGFLAILILLLEMMVLMGGGGILFNRPDFLTGGFDWVYLLHLAIVGVSNTFIIYNIIVKNNVLTETFYQDSNRDFLTGGYNRRYLNEYFATMNTQSPAKGDNYLFFCDIDDFKIINDSFGHDIGDRVLRLFAQEITSQIRSHDIFGRYGGDEFVIVVNNLPKDDVAGFKERIVENFANKTRQQFGFEVSVSIGAARVDGSLETALKQADGAMYQNKTMKKTPGF
ncbi:MAG: GGDEF domain-containing protein [Erysipelotrichaceae bacterium]|nr:GGDEF domain-containing protein [Erysipelotrichaceae bacterium]